LKTICSSNYKTLTVCCFGKSKEIASFVSVSLYHSSYVIRFYLPAILVLGLFKSNYIATQNQFSYTEENGKSKTKDFSILEYLINDTYVTGGINRGGVFWSNEFRNLEYENGLQLGIEGYTPIAKKAFLNIGFSYAQRNFSHSPITNNTKETITFRNHFIEMPIFLSHELPEFKQIDFRFILGIQFAYRFAGSQKKSYSSETMSNSFFYKQENFKRFDGGLNFGLSGEYQDIYFRLRSFVGHNSIYGADTGMLNAFYIDFGFFLFRNLKNRKE
jgi:hypothetical protein